MRVPESKDSAGTDARASTPTYFVSRTVTDSVLGWPSVIDHLRSAYASPHADASNPRRSIARDSQAWVRTLTAIPPSGSYMGVKVFGLGPQKMVNYAIVLIRRESGLIAGIVDGAPITAMRTAATSALAVERLARRGPCVLGMLGSGDEASAHIEAIATVRDIVEIRVFSPTRQKRETFARRFEERLKIPVRALASSEEVTQGADILVAAARSRDETPIVHAHSLQAGMLVVSIGSTVPEQREIDISVVERCDLIVCDAVDEVCQETGDMLAASAAGIKFDHKIISLNELIADSSGKHDGAQLPLFKSVGSAIQDVVVAGLALERAIAAGTATKLPIDFYTKRP
jgi:alanine dehydrogenase